WGDIQHLIHQQQLSGEEAFTEVVRYTSGRARDFVLNLKLDGQTDGRAAIDALRDEFSCDKVTRSPMANFHARTQQPNESPGDFAISLRALLRKAADKDKSILALNKDDLLTSQFMAGVRFNVVRNRLAPMKPRAMLFKELRKELQIIADGTLDMRQSTLYEIQTPDGIQAILEKLSPMETRLIDLESNQPMQSSGHQHQQAQHQPTDHQAWHQHPAHYQCQHPGQQTKQQHQRPQPQHQQQSDTLPTSWNLKCCIGH
ncbi:uncharacterized protein LOC117117438, partial [Anneissia japonica]|uniref:uncharacterized protein LOC117117438 n=1 Tax=Anneissia japonica TaxID=1529436 RepID=UPI0014257E6F